MATERSEDIQSIYSREQRVGVFLLAIFALLVVGLGLLQMRNTIYKQFVIRIPESTDASSLLERSDVVLQQRDTDRDGLSDFDEQQFYGTSIYLPDTDSDGIKDRAEVDAGTDPTCPEGQDCGVSVAPANNTSASSPLLDTSDSLEALTNLNDVIAQQVQSTSTSTPPASPTPSQEAETLELLTNDPELLREALAGSGVIAPEILAGFDNETLLQLANELRAAQTTP